MKNILLLAAFAAGLALCGANIIPNGDLSDPDGPKPHVQYFRGKGVRAASEKGFMMKDVTPDGIIKLNIYHTKLTAPQVGKRYYVRVPFEVLEMGTAKDQKVSASVALWDKNKKLLPRPGTKKPTIFFSRDLPVKETGAYDIFFDFVMPEGAEYISFAFSFYGIKSFRAEKFICSPEFPVDSPDGNLILNGGLETPTMTSYYLRYISKSPLRIFERTTDKAKSGRWSLRMRCEDPKRGMELNFNNLPFTPGKKYRFKASYFVASRVGKTRLSGRVTFVDAKGKVIRYIFPEFPAGAGQWQQMDLPFYPPVNCARVLVTLWFDGVQTVYLDDFYYGFAEEKTPENRNAAARQLVDTADCTIWKEAAYLKVQPKGVPAGVRKSRTVEVAAAANESEPFQIVVSAKKALPDVTLAFSPLKGKSGGNPPSAVTSAPGVSVCPGPGPAGCVIPPSAITFKRVGFIDLKNPDNPSLKGLNADPLLPEQSGPADKELNLPFFVRVAVPPKTPAGIYEGQAWVFSGYRVLGTFTLRLRVFDFELPDTPNLRTYFYSAGNNPNWNQFDKRPWEVRTEDFHRQHVEHRMTGNPSMTPPAPKWTIDNGELKITDWTAFDENVAHRVRNYGQRNFPVPILRMRGDNGGWFAKGGKRLDKPGKSSFGDFNMISPEGLKYAGQFAKQFCDHVKMKFPGIDFYAYIYDEPPAKVHAELKIYLDAVHKAAPELKVFIPKQVGDEVGYVHTFCVPLAPGYYHPDRQDVHVKKGGGVWYYNWTVRISNHDYILTRLFGWRIYAGKGTGGLLWSTNWTNKGVNPWTDLEKTGNSCGGATIFYPPRNAGEPAVPSQRGAMIREAIDDFDYMAILEKLIDSRYPGMGRLRVMELLKPLIPTPPFGYVNDPHLLYRVRQDLAEEIEAFKQFPAVAVSTPSANARTEVSTVKFKISAPAGTEVKIDGKPAGKTGSGALEIPFVLGKLGTNTVRIELACGGRIRTMERTFELAADPRLKELAALVERAAGAKLDTRGAAAFLAQVRQGSAYSEKERAKAAELVDKLKYALAERALAADRTFANPLEKFFFERARETFKWKLFERSEYYLGLAAEAARAGKMENFKVKITPVVFKGHTGFRLDNGLIQATILETGGTVVSFKVDGVETLVPGRFDKVMPPEKRAAQIVTKDQFTALSGYDGYTDADGHGIWPVAFVDWDVALRQLTSDRIALTFSIRIPGRSFLFKRTMSMKSGSYDLGMDYEVVNLTSPDAASDDPEHYQLPWRGRFLPGIGSGEIPQVNDKLVIPFKYDRDKMELTHFILSKPVFIDRRSARLTKPFLGAYDTVLHKGLVAIGGPVTTHAMLWFSTKGDHKGGGKVYTLEFPRSFFGKKYDDAEPNTPLSIQAGKTLNFSITLRGLSSVKDDADLIRQAGF